jgi:hypothetical protein
LARQSRSLKVQATIPRTGFFWHAPLLFLNQSRTHLPKTNKNQRENFLRAAFALLPGFAPYILRFDLNHAI